MLILVYLALAIPDTTPLLLLSILNLPGPNATSNRLYTLQYRLVGFLFSYEILLQGKSGGSGTPLHAVCTCWL